MAKTVTNYQRVFIPTATQGGQAKRVHATKLYLIGRNRYGWYLAYVHKNELGKTLKELRQPFVRVVKGKAQVIPSRVKFEKMSLNALMGWARSMIQAEAKRAPRYVSTGDYRQWFKRADRPLTNRVIVFRCKGATEQEMIAIQA